MATNISIDVYNFSTGNDFSYKGTQPFVVSKIVNYEPASIYNFRNVHFTDVRSKITADMGGVLKDHYVAQTVAEIKTLIDA